MKYITIFILLLNLLSCSPQDASRIGYALGYTLALEASYAGNINDIHYYRVNNCNRTYYILFSGRYSPVDCRFLSIFDDHVVYINQRASFLPLYYLE